MGNAVSYPGGNHGALVNVYRDPKFRPAQTTSVAWGPSDEFVKAEHERYVAQHESNREPPTLDQVGNWLRGFRLYKPNLPFSGCVHCGRPAGGHRSAWGEPFSEDGIEYCNNPGDRPPREAYEDPRLHDDRENRYQALWDHGVPHT